MMRALLLSTVVVFSYASVACARPQEETMQMLDLFGDVFDKVKSDYVEEVSDKELIESAINGMLSSLDPHSSYLNAEDFQEMQIQTSGKFGGLGIEVTMENGLVKVVTPIDDTPAAKAGLQAGDYISKIDDESVMGITLREAVDKMRGDPGTDITLEILRKDESEPLIVELTRAIIKIESVKHNIIDKSIGYFRVTAFSEHTSSLLEKKIKAVKKELGDEMVGVVLDLRNNPGGLLDQAIEISDLFLKRGEIVSTGGRISESKKRFNAEKGDVLDGLPIVVLINAGSASASEIVAGALQDHKRAIITGSQSFGKGSVQTVLPLSASNGAMRLTTSRYYTPSGRSIQAEGIEPDIIIRQSKIETLMKGDTPGEAQLRKHLANEENKNDNKDNKDSDEKEDKDTSGVHRESQDIYEKDYQLGRASDLVKAAHLFNAPK